MPDRLTEIQERLAKATPHQDLWQAAVGFFKAGDLRLLHQDDMALLVNAPTDLTYLLARLAKAEAALKKYGQHLMDCHHRKCASLGYHPAHNPGRHECTCGFTTWREAQEE